MFSLVRHRKFVAPLIALALFGGVACGKSSTKTDSKADPDKVAVEKTIRDILAAEEAKDGEAFVALWTDKGLKEFDSGSREEIKSGKAEGFGEDTVKLVGFAETDVTATTATTTIDVTPESYNVVKVLFRAKFSLIKQGAGWLIDGFEFLGSPPAKSGADVVDIKAQEYAFILDKDKASAEVAFKLTNVGKQDHEISLFKTPDGVDLATARKAVEDVDGGELDNIPDGYKVDHVAFAEAGSAGKPMNVTFAGAPSKGTYLLACFIPDGGFGENGPINPNGKPHIKLGMAALLTIA